MRGGLGFRVVLGLLPPLSTWLMSMVDGGHVKQADIPDEVAELGI